MALKPRFVSIELRILRSLNTRMNLSADERKRYLKLEKGYQGEVMFDQLTEKLQSDMIVLNDLCLEVNSSTFQIDHFSRNALPYQSKKFMKAIFIMKQTLTVSKRYTSTKLRIH